MADLIQEFFKRDLSESEQESLSQLLKESPDAVTRYERLLEKNYLATGLPQPSLPQGLQNLPQLGNMATSALSGWVKVIALALAASGVVVWKFWPQAPAEVPVTAIQTAPQIQAIAPVKESQPKVNAQPSLPSQLLPQPVSPSTEGEELSVVVDASQTALVTVRILDDKGQEIRALYTGFVQPGRWSFHWDGILSNGQPATAGDYRIDVQSGASHQAKAIQIK